MQWSALFGAVLVASLLGMMGVQLMDDGAAFLFSPLAMAWVFGGTVGLLLLSHPLERFVRLAARLGDGFRDGEHQEELAFLQTELVQLHASKLRKGDLNLESYADSRHDPLLRDAMHWAADAHEEQEGTMREWLVMQLRRLEDEYVGLRQLLSQATAAALGLGAFGLLAGILPMMAHFNEPAAWTEGWRLAASSLCYGLFLVILVFRPIAARLERTLEMERLRVTIIGEGVMMIQLKWPPKMMHDRLQRLSGVRRKTFPRHELPKEQKR